MDLQLIVAVNVAAISVLLLLQMLAMSIMARRWMGNAAMAAANAIVLAAFAAAHFLLPDDIGTVVTAVSVPLVLAPLTFAMLSLRAANQSRLKASACYARLAAAIHPTRTYRFNAAVARAWASGNAEQRAAALHAQAQTAQARNVRYLAASAARALDDWTGVAELTRKDPRYRQDTAALEIRAMGELDRIDEMTCAFEHSQRYLVGPALADCQLYLMAFSGREDAAEHLLRTACAHIAEEAKAYWRAVAALRSVRHDAAPMAALAAGAREDGTRRAAVRHLAATSARSTLSDLAKFRLDTVEDLVRRTPPIIGKRLRDVPATWALLALLAVAFAVEIREGGSEDIETLVRLGAIWPPLVLRDSEWWRLGAALLLHLGPLHLAANALNLWVLGRLVEAKLGGVRMLAAFWLGGLASSTGVVLLMQEGYLRRGVLVGASGAVMALLGVIVARQGALLLRHRDGLEGRRLMVLAMIIMVQVAADMLVPQISFAAHACGFVAGLVIGALLLVSLGSTLQGAAVRRTGTTASPRS